MQSQCCFTELQSFPSYKRHVNVTSLLCLVSVICKSTVLYVMCYAWTHVLYNYECCSVIWSQHKYKADHSCFPDHSLDNKTAQEDYRSWLFVFQTNECDELFIVGFLTYYMFLEFWLHSSISADIAFHIFQRKAQSVFWMLLHWIIQEWCGVSLTTNSPLQPPPSADACLFCLFKWHCCLKCWGGGFLSSWAMHSLTEMLCLVIA